MEREGILVLLRRGSVTIRCSIRSRTFAFWRGLASSYIIPTRFLNFLPTDSAQRYPGYVTRGEVRASKDAISEIAGIACMFWTQAETATCQTLCQTRGKCLQHAKHPSQSARDRDARARFAHDSAQTLAQLAFQKNPPSAYPLRQA